MTKKASLLSDLFNFGKRKLSDSERYQIEQMIQLIEDVPPSQISDNEILDMEAELHQIYYPAKRSIANHQVVNWIGEALDSMSSAADMVGKNPKKRPREVSENLRSAAEALNTALVYDELD